VAGRSRRDVSSWKQAKESSLTVFLDFTAAWQQYVGIMGRKLAEKDPVQVLAVLEALKIDSKVTGTKKVSQAKVTKLTGISRGQVNKIATACQAHGLLCKEEDAALVLTAAGIAALKKLGSQQQNSVMTTEIEGQGSESTDDLTVCDDDSFQFTSPPANYEVSRSRRGLGTSRGKKR
jgi:hypothetical protein